METATFVPGVSFLSTLARGCRPRLGVISDRRLAPSRRLGHELPDGVDDRDDLPVVILELLFQLVEPRGQLAVVGQHLAQLDQRADEAHLL
jgi:hypothetical protein